MFGKLMKTMFFVFLLLSTFVMTSCDEEDIIQKVVNIAFEVHGGPAIDPIAYDGSDLSVWPDDPIWTGYVFEGWFLDDQTFKAPFDITTYVVDENAQDFTVYAYWTPVIYQIFYQDTGGSTIENASYHYGEETEPPMDPIYDGHAFTGWYEDAAREILHEFGDMPAHDLTLYAGWETLSYTVLYDTMGGSELVSSDVLYDTVVVPPAEPTYEGYAFDGWYLSPTYETVYVFGDMPAHDLTLYAKWTPLTYTVTYDTVGGSLIDPADVVFDTLVPEPDDPVKDSQTFAGWYLDIETTEPYDFGRMPAHDLTLYALWHVTLSFETYDGSEVLPLTGHPGDPFDQPDDPVLANHLFTGWYEDESLLIPYDSDTLPDVHMTIYAGWALETVSLSFINNGGTHIDQADVPIGTSLMSFLPTRDEHVFAGWYQDSSLTTRVTHAPENDATLYADWLSITTAPVGSGMNYTVPSDEADDGIDDVRGGFRIAVIETTYAVWYEVRRWGETQGYVFSNLGREGSHGIVGAMPSGQSLPVTDISYRDIIVWLNTLSEMTSYTPIYRDASNQIIKNATTTDADDAIQSINPGYRLPLNSEWNMAARMLLDPEPLTASLFMPSGYWTPGNFAAGAYRAYDAFDGMETLAVSWYDANSSNTTHGVAGLRPTQLGLYDMSGNVAEICFDIHASSLKHYVRGGGYNRGWNIMQIGHYDAYSPTAHDIGSGFRLVLDQLV
ncbi:MAG: InlB B-repeat-containing protein [Acholeplasmataceae bacterium]|nr:InlB B-repeat-containing protein [Acholeplasmataceae bacterium]